MRRRPTADSAADRERLLGARPGLLLEDVVALDAEDTAGVAEIEELEQLGLDVELGAGLAEPTRDPEAETLRPIREPEGRIEAADDEAAEAAWTAFARAWHLGCRRASWRASATLDLTAS